MAIIGLDFKALEIAIQPPNLPKRVLLFSFKKIYATLRLFRHGLI